jgi:hypothetical protein
VKRAKQLIGTLKRQLQAWADAHQHFIEATHDADTGQISLAVARFDTDRLGRVSITSGETIYNLRAALDYIIFDLARIQAGKPVGGTQFPIDETPAVFESRITGRNKKGERTDEDLGAAAAEFAARENFFTYDELFRLALQAREEERERASRSRLSLSLAVLREWLTWQWYRWRSPDEASQTNQIAVDMAGGSGGLPDLPAR